MAIVDLVMPKLGESIMEATILKWHKAPGEQVKMDEPVLDIATDKVDSEVPSSVDGVLQDILYQVNDVVPIGAVIARIDTNSNQQESSNTATGDTTPVTKTAASGNSETAYPNAGNHSTTALSGDILTVQSQETPSSSPGRNFFSGISSQRFYSPLVLTIAAREGISMQELETLPGTGTDQRVTKKDILQHVARKKAGGQRSTGSQATGSYTAAQETHPGLPVIGEKDTGYTYATPVASGNVEIIEMDRMRKLIARHMVDSVQTSPHVTSFAEADVTNLVLWRERVKKTFEKRENEKLTFTPLFIEAIIRCIKKYPWLNSSIEGDKLIVKKDINMGMATALPSGNLIVPVIKNADQLNLVGLTRQVNRLANDARANRLRPDDTAGGTFTLTNIGTFGSIMGTPIINQPQVAIMAIGTIKKRPVVIETDQGDSIAIRHMMYLSMSYDHRIIDGALGSTFLNAVARELENFDSSREV